MMHFNPALPQPCFISCSKPRHSEITAGGANNTYETCDTLGRQLFVAFTAKF
jgi:hypothetical protein